MPAFHLAAATAACHHTFLLRGWSSARPLNQLDDWPAIARGGLASEPAQLGQDGRRLQSVWQGGQEEAEHGDVRRAGVNYQQGDRSGAEVPQEDERVVEAGGELGE